MSALEEQDIYGRRYFYPSLAKSLPYVGHSDLKVTDDISKRVFCLPLYFDLNPKDIGLICKFIIKVTNNELIGFTSS